MNTNEHEMVFRLNHDEGTTTTGTRSGGGMEKDAEGGRNWDFNTEEHRGTQSCTGFVETLVLRQRTNAPPGLPDYREPCFPGFPSVTPINERRSTATTRVSTESVARSWVGVAGGTGEEGVVVPERAGAKIDRPQRAEPHGLGPIGRLAFPGLAVGPGSSTGVSPAHLLDPLWPL